EVYEQPESERHQVYGDPAWRNRAKADLAREELADIWDARWQKVTVEESDVHHSMCGGASIADLAAARGVHPLDLLCDLALAEGLQTRFRIVQANDDDTELERLLAEESIALLGLSDAGAHADQLCDAVFGTSLLARWVRERRSISLEHAVWRLTG